MASPILFFETPNVQVGQSGASGYLLFTQSGVSVQVRNIVAYSDSDWLTLGPIDLEGLRIPYTASTNTSAQRTAVVTLQGKIAPAYQQTVEDYATIVQMSASAGAGSITPSTYSYLCKSVGETSAITYSLYNIATDGSLGVSADQSWLFITGFDRSGFTFSCERNTTEATRNATVRVAAHINGSRDYAEAFITFTQPAMEDRGYILFTPAELITESGGTTTSVTYDYSNILHLNYPVTSNSWITVTSSATTGSLTITIDSNPYRQRRNGTVTLYATSSSDGSTIQGTLYINQAAGSGDLPIGQVSFRESTVMAPSDEPYSGGTQYDTFNMDDSTVYISDYQGNFAQAPTIVSTSAKVVEWKMAAPTNQSGFTTSYITLGGYDINNKLIESAAQLMIIQPPFVEQLEFPIWKDTDILINDEDGSDEYIDYIISVSGITKYQGRAYTLGNKCVVRLNEIMETFLIPELDLNNIGVQDNNAYINGVMGIGVNGTVFEPFKKIKCFADWSYEEHNRRFLSCPISNVIDNRQRFICTAIDYSDLQPTVVITTTTSQGGSNVQLYSLYNQIGTIVDYAWGGIENITARINNLQMTYLVKSTCKRYCLYYLNAYGGWDSYLFNNTSKEKDSFTRSTFKRRINNQNIIHGTVEYKNKIQKGWTLKTDYLNDRQSIIFARHLASSPSVYLHDLEEDIIYPVNIVTGSVDYKTFIRNGRKFNRYDIEVELAQERYRR